MGLIDWLKGRVNWGVVNAVWAVAVIVGFVYRWWVGCLVLLMGVALAVCDVFFGVEDDGDRE